MTIEKGVAMPPSQFAKRKYPEFREMEVGDSVFFASQKSTGRAATAAKLYGHRNGKRFSSRNMDGGVRIWRTA